MNEGQPGSTQRGEPGAAELILPPHLWPEEPVVVATRRGGLGAVELILPPHLWSEEPVVVATRRRGAVELILPPHVNLKWGAFLLNV